MNSMKKLLLLAALALVALAASAGSASAARGVKISPGGAITQTSQGKITFAAGETRIECNLTLTGNLETRLVTFVRGTLIRIGTITRVDWRECVGGEVEAVLNLPWNVALNQILEEPRNCRPKTPEEAVYNKACGALIVILGPQFQLSIFGGFARCLYGSATESVGALLPVTLLRSNEREAEYSMGLLRILPTQNTFRLARGFGCPERGTMTGTFNEASPRQTLTLLA